MQTDKKILLCLTSDGHAKLVHFQVCEQNLCKTQDLRHLSIGEAIVALLHELERIKLNLSFHNPTNDYENS